MSAPAFGRDVPGVEGPSTHAAVGRKWSDDIGDIKEVLEMPTAVPSFGWQAAVIGYVTVLSAAFLAESVRSSLSFFPVFRSTEMPVVAKKRFGTARSGGAKKSSRSNWKVVMPRRLASPLRSENLATRVTFISIVVPAISPSP